MGFTNWKEPKGVVLTTQGRRVSGYPPRPLKMESISNNEVIILRNLKGLGIMNHLQKQQGSAVGRD